MFVANVDSQRGNVAGGTIACKHLLVVGGNNFG